jgi:two-component system cell cycle sensor histidine kinase/response regulator CckA
MTLLGLSPRPWAVASVLLLAACLSAPESAPANPLRPPVPADDIDHDVLLIQSYDQLMSWGIALQTAIVDSLGIDGHRVRLSVENLDSKLHNSPEYFEACRRLLAVKYAATRFDLVLTADNNAFTFVREHRDELFPGAPVVFGGLNGYGEDMLAGFPGVTGVAEVYSARETIELALTLLPQTRHVYVINDHLVTGRAAAREIDLQLLSLEPRITVEHAPALSLDEHRRRLAALPDGTVVLLGVFYADRDGRHSTFEEIGAQLAQASRVPVFCVLEFNVGGGSVGGRVVSGYGQGAAMARLAGQVLHGRPPADLPVVAERANRFVFDHRQLTRWGIAEDRLPPGSLVIERPFSAWRAYRGQLIGVAVFVVLLLAAVLGLAENIRRRRESESRLRRSEENLAVTLRSIGDAVVATDREGRVVRMNRQAERITGWMEAEALGRPVGEVVPVVDLETGEPLRDPARRVLEAGAGGEGGHRGLLVARDGREVIIEDSGAPILRRDGMVAGVVMVFRDVTARTDLEDRLRHSQKMEAVGQLAGGVAHDFNNMLAGIMGYAEMVAEDDLPEVERKEFAGHILAAAGRASDLTRKLLAFSRKGKVLSTPLDVHAAIREAAALLARSVDRRIELRLDLQAENASVIGDPTQIQQAILNLGLNARDAMPDGGVLTIATANRWLEDEVCRSRGDHLVPGDYVAVTVRDTGCGMAPDVQARIFEPFFTTKPVGEGTGLGLAAVRGTVEEHQGCIEVQSAPGAGTSFEILLPLSGLPAPMLVADTVTPDLPAGTLLIIDDEPVIRGMVQRMLTALGWRVLAAADGVAGLEIYGREGRTIDVVLLDMVMPRMTGRECFAAIRALDPGARVIVASGFAAEHAVADMMAEGLDAFLKKPYRQADLLRTLARVMSGEPGTV